LQLCLFRRPMRGAPSTFVFTVCALAVAFAWGEQAKGLPYDQQERQQQHWAARGELAVEIDRGDKGSLKVLLFLHGWPDTPLVWAQQIAHFCPQYSQTGYRCVALALPGYSVGSSPVPPSLGFDFDELADMLASSTQKLRDEFSASSEGVKRQHITLVSHDWGAWIGFVAEKSDTTLFDAMIPLDVGPGSGPREGENSLLWVAKIVWYQLLNVDAHFTAQWLPLVGERWANVALRSFTWLIMGKGFGMVTPTPLAHISHTMAYPYVQAWKMLDPSLATFLTRGYEYNAEKGVSEVPRCPTLFLAGGRGVNLHGKWWFESILRKGSGGNGAAGDGASRALVLENCHHWLFSEGGGCVERVNTEMRSFLSTVHA